MILKIKRVDYGWVFYDKLWNVSVSPQELVKRENIRHHGFIPSQELCNCDELNVYRVFAERKNEGDTLFFEIGTEAYLLNDHGEVIESMRPDINSCK